MKIISVRKGFASDHSSTSYEFLAVDRPLDKKARAVVSSLSSRADPTRRRVSFIYHADGYDIPGGWEPLMRDYYDVMCSESYGWWHLALAFPVTPQQREEIVKYSFDGVDDLGVYVSFHDKRAIVAIYCCLVPFGPFDDEYDEYLASFAEDDEGADENKAKINDETALVDDLVAEMRDPLLLLLYKIRKQLMDGDYRALYEVWKKYHYPEDEYEGEEDEEWSNPPVPEEKKSGKKIIAEFAGMLDVI